MKFWRDLFFKDPLRKIIALSLTVVLYAVLNEGKQQHRDIGQVMLEIEGGEDVFIPKAERSCYVNLSVRGSESRIKKLRSQDINGKAKDIVGKVRVVGDPAAFSAGTLKLHLAPEHFRCPRGIEVIAIEPAVLTLPIQRKISRDVPVEPVITGKPQPGRATSGIRCFPERVTVTGPERAVQALASIRTEPLSIDGEVMTFDKEMKLINPMPGEFDFDAQSTNISVTIIESPDVPREIRDVPVRYLASPLHQSRGLIPSLPDRSRVSVMITGQQGAVNRITASDITVYADIGDPRYAQVGEHQVPLRAVLPVQDGGARVTGIVPDKVTIRIRSASDRDGK